MMSRGIQGAIVDWFGPNDPTTNGATMLLKQQAEAHPGFEFAIMEDSGALFAAAQQNNCNVTIQLISNLNYINSQYESSPAYAHVNGRPIVLFFGVDTWYMRLEPGESIRSGQNALSIPWAGRIYRK